MVHLATNRWLSSSMIWVCLKSTNGVIRLLLKLLGNLSNKMDFIGLIKLKEEISRALKIFLMLVQWIILEEVETIFLIVLKDNFSSSIWFFLFPLKESMDPLYASNSDLMLKIMDLLMRLRKSSKIWLEQLLSCGIMSKKLCFLLLPNSIISSICVS